MTTYMTFVIHQKIIMLYFKQSVALIHGLIKEKEMITLLLLSFIGQRVVPKNLALMQIILL